MVIEVLYFFLILIPILLPFIY